MAYNENLIKPLVDVNHFNSLSVPACGGVKWEALKHLRIHQHCKLLTPLASDGRKDKHVAPCSTTGNLQLFLTLSLSSRWASQHCFPTI